MKSYLIADKLRDIYWRDKLNHLSQNPKLVLLEGGIVDKKDPVTALISNSGRNF